MARLPRVVVADIAHHVTQRGNARQVIFASDTDRLAYLELLGQHCEQMTQRTQDAERDGTNFLRGGSSIVEKSPLHSLPAVKTCNGLVT